MPQQNTDITKSSVLNDFITTVMDPARNTLRWYAGNVPTITNRIWDNGTVLVVAPYAVINQSALDSQSSGMNNPQNYELGNNQNLIQASEIVNLLRSYASNTTKIRRAQMGLYYTQYYNGQYTNTGVPSDNPYAHASGVITGVAIGSHPTGIDYTHLIDSYKLSISTSGPNQNEIIYANVLNNFYSNLRSAADAGTNGSSVVDLRICHSSCHNNCHGSRGRR